MLILVKQKVTVTTESGLHFRPASKLSEEALKYDCEILFKVGDITGSLKSFLGILAAGIKQGCEIEIICEGKEEDVALDNIVALIANNLE